MKILVKALLISLLFCTPAAAQSGHLLHKDYRVKYRYLDSLRAELDMGHIKDPIGHLEALIAWSGNAGDDEFAGELALLRLRYTRTDADSSTINSLAALLQHARAGKHKYLEADVLQELGAFLMDRKRYSLAFENLLAAHTIYSRFSIADFPHKSEYLYGLGGAYYRYEDNENAIRYMKEAQAAGAGEGQLLFRPILNTIGLCYRRMAKFDSADWYFRQIYNSALRQNDSGWVGIAGGNIGINFFLQHRYAEAKPLVERDVEFSLLTGNIRNAINSMTILASIEQVENNFKRAEELLVRALAIAESRSFWPDYDLAERLYSGLYKVYAAKNDMRRAYLYADSTIMVKDSLARLVNALNFSKAKERAAYAEHRLETQQLESRRNMQVLLRNGLIALLLLLTVIAILFINRQRLRRHKLEAEKKHTEAELGVAAMQLESFRKSVQEKNTIIERVTGEIDRMKKEQGSETDPELLSQLERSIILTDEQWEHFRQLFEKVHKGFFSNLRAKMPDLTQAEIRFLALTKMKLSSKEMAAMLGISTNAIRIYRHRLRKKLDLDKEDMIEELVENI